MLIKSQSKCTCMLGAVYTSTPSQFTRPSFRFFKGLVPRLCKHMVLWGFAWCHAVSQCRPSCLQEWNLAGKFANFGHHSLKISHCFSLQISVVPLDSSSVFCSFTLMHMHRELVYLNWWSRPIPYP